MRKRWIWLAPLAILAMLALVALGGEVVLQLWNWLLPPLFGLRQITFWQALGVLVLCRILFGRLGGPGSYRRGFRRRMAERREHMTPEERKRFRQGIRGRCGLGHLPAKAPGNDREQQDSSAASQPPEGRN